MKELDKSKVYDLLELTNEERKELYEHLCNLQEELKLISVDEYDILEYKTYNKWCYWYKENSIKYKYTTHNAKELFYTLENVQVDCRGLTEEQIKEMCKVYENNGIKPHYETEKINLEVRKHYEYLRCNEGVFIVTGYDKNKTTITYEKFMELFGEPQYEVKYIAEAPTEEKPQHYSKGIDTFARMEANCTKEECLAFAKGNIDKYNWREKGQDLEDYKKIIAYANWAIKLLEK